MKKLLTILLFFTCVLLQNAHAEMIHLAERDAMLDRLNAVTQNAYIKQYFHPKLLQYADTDIDSFELLRLIVSSMYDCLDRTPVYIRKDLGQITKLVPFYIRALLPHHPSEAEGLVNQWRDNGGS